MTNFPVSKNNTVDEVDHPADYTLASSVAAETGGGAPPVVGLKIHTPIP